MRPPIRPPPLLAACPRGRGDLRRHSYTSRAGCLAEFRTVTTWRWRAHLEAVLRSLEESEVDCVVEVQRAALRPHGVGFRSELLARRAEVAVPQCVPEGDGDRDAAGGPHR